MKGQGKPRMALLLGAYGQSNLGDDVLLHNYLRFLSDRGFEHIHVNTAQAGLVPSVTLQQFPGVRLFEAYQTSARDLLRLIRQADCIIYGGGTVYKELYASTGRSPYPLLVRLALFNAAARAFKKPLYHLHIGIGSIKTALGRRLTRSALKRSTQTVFRDEESYRFATDTLGVTKARLAHSTDALFIHPNWQKEWHHYDLNLPRKKRGGDQKVVGINILSDIPDWVDRAHYLTTITQFVNWLAREGHQVVFLPFQTDFNPSNDLSFVKKEIWPNLKDQKNCHIAADVALDTIISALRQVDVLVGMRFHSLLLATVAGTPFVGIAYDTKCWRFLQEHDYQHALKIEDLSLHKLENYFDHVLADDSIVRTQLAGIAKHNFEAAAAWQQDFIL